MPTVFSLFNVSSQNAQTADQLFIYRFIHISASGLFSISIRHRQDDPIRAHHAARVSAVSVHKQNATCPIMLPQQPPRSSSAKLLSSMHSQRIVKPRIVGGESASQELKRYMVFFATPRETDDSMYSVCSGALVSKFYAITAAHCTINEKTLAFIGGDQGNPPSGAANFVSEFIQHPKYFGIFTFPYDIALVRLKEAAPPNSLYMNVNTNEAIPAPGSYVRVAGYGVFQFPSSDAEASNDNSALHQVDLPVTKRSECVDAYENSRADVDYDMQVCAGYMQDGGCDSW